MRQNETPSQVSKESCPTKSFSCDKGSQTTPTPPKCSTAQAEVKGSIHGRSFMLLFWLSSNLSQTYFCCIPTCLLNVILRPSVKSWDWTSRCCCCCCNKGSCRVLVCKSVFSFLRYVEPESWRKKMENVHLSGDWGGGSYLEIFPSIIYQLAPALEDSKPKAKPLLLRKILLAFLPI